MVVFMLPHKILLRVNLVGKIFITEKTNSRIRGKGGREKS